MDVQWRGRNIFKPVTFVSVNIKKTAIQLADTDIIEQKTLLVVKMWVQIYLFGKHLCSAHLSHLYCDIYLSLIIFEHFPDFKYINCNSWRKNVYFLSVLIMFQLGQGLIKFNCFARSYLMIYHLQYLYNIVSETKLVRMKCKMVQ